MGGLLPSAAHSSLNRLGQHFLGPFITIPAEKRTQVSKTALTQAALVPTRALLGGAAPGANLST